MPFFDQPGSQAGPYSTPPQQGTFSKIMAGVNVALQLGDFYQNWQAKSQDQKSKAIKGLADEVGITQALNQGDVPASPDFIDRAGKLGIALPKMTEDMQSGMASKFLPTPAPLIEGGMTSPTDPAQVARQTAQVQGMASIPAVGTPMIPGKAKTMDQMKVKVLEGLTPDKQSQALFRGMAENPIYDDNGDVIGYSRGKPTQLRPSQESKTQDWQDRESTRQQNRMNLKQTPGASGGKGGGGGGRPETINEARLFEKALDEYRKQPGNENTTRVDFGPIYSASRKPGYTKTTKKPSMRETTTEMTPKGGPSAAPGPKPAGQETITPTAADVPLGTRRKTAGGTVWQNINGTISKVE